MKIGYSFCRGFADALHMELLPYKVNVSLLYPPNTETEGFKLELETMPEETMLISDSAGIFSPEDVAKAHVNDIEAGNYTTTMGLDGWMCGKPNKNPEKMNIFRRIDSRCSSGEKPRSCYDSILFGWAVSWSDALLFGLFQWNCEEMLFPKESRTRRTT